MSTSDITPAKAILLAVKAAAAADVATLRILIATCSKTLNPIFLRILLTYLPESLESSEYVQLLVDYESGPPPNAGIPPLDQSPLQGISEAQAAQEVRKLRLLKLRAEKCPDAPEDDLALFLLHRAYRIDQETGLITQLPELIGPFLDRSEYLQRWMLGTVLPVLRLNYEYHPSPKCTQSLDWFEGLYTSGAVEFLLSRTLRPQGAGVGRNLDIVPDVRGLTGPWLYGYNQWKRRKVSGSEMAAQTIEPLSSPTAKTQKKKYGDWDALFAWILHQASTQHSAIAELLEQWHDARDVDLGGYGVAKALLSDDDAEQINAHYAHCTVSSAFRIPERTLPALSDAHRILMKASERVGLGPIPTLQASAALLAPVFEFTEEDRSIKEQVMDLIIYLRNEECQFSKPTHHTVHFVHALLTSTYLLLRSTETSPTIEQTAQLLVLDDPFRQKALLMEFLNGIVTSGGDDKLWLRRRNEILWLHDWGLQPHLEPASESANHKGRGPFGLLPLAELHQQFLRTLIYTSRKLTPSPKAP